MDTDIKLPSYYGYIGSKSGFCPQLVPLMPNESQISYCELFAGGEVIRYGELL